MIENSKHRKKDRDKKKKKKKKKMSKRRLYGAVKEKVYKRM